jgi:hypothetical protein
MCQVFGGTSYIIHPLSSNDLFTKQRGLGISGDVILLLECRRHLALWNGFIESKISAKDLMNLAASSSGGKKK